MLHRRVMGACSAVVAVGALALAGLPGTAAARPAESPPPSASAHAPEVSPGMLKAMKRDLGLSTAEAKTKLVNEREAGATAGSLRLALEGDFGGSWVSGDTSKLTVATTDASAVSRIEGQGARAKVVKHSLAELEAAKSALDRAAKRHAPDATPVWYVEVRTNTVELLSSKPSEARTFAEDAGVAADAVSVKRSHAKPRALYDIRGGDAYYIGSGSRCSVGFSVTRGGQSGFVTAGHCGQPGQTTTGSNRQAQGSFTGSSFPGNDYAHVAANSQWTSTPTVNSSPQQVAGSTVAQVGSSICRSGSTTGWHCGSVQQLNTSVTYPQGTVSGVTRTNVCAEPGDSGGSFISGDQAQGMTSGGSGNCTSGGTTYFQPVNEALQVYGATLTTTDDGGGPDPEPPGGTWAASTVYQPGDSVTYGGVTYRCLQGHQAQAGWEPPNVPALWQRV
ncbi:alpha-lytic protease prodomain-containing protein [Streptomyces sp. N2-109]|uniref:Alpha-lytic protease prodomain-containing protein n=1 Tax=Streptomyces gossypii TaxID=2883101 RepID=A0ABT2JR71_9ACTN|nr:carbohydrate-binding protein [Streptomyces gossypii]MCT2589984.1 alpha-lytic protease prodomain-containing protein [Streptomyces gossypii]